MEYATLNNGVRMPRVGYGVYQVTSEECERCVLDALEVGYRAIDTAQSYGNEAAVGSALQKSGLPRPEVFLTTKIWISNAGYEKARASIDKSLANLRTDYIDLLLIHQPFGDYYGAYRAMEEAYKEGKVRAIGVSNFLPHHLEELAATARIKPMVNQIEFHPGWAHLDIVDYCLKNDIIPEAWSPMARSGALSNETLISLAEKYGKTPAQICLRWVLQHGLRPIPKSVTPSRMAENLDIYDFHIEEADMAAIDALENCGGSCHNPDTIELY